MEIVENPRTLSELVNPVECVRRRNGDYLLRTTYGGIDKINGPMFVNLRSGELITLSSELVYPISAELHLYPGDLRCRVEKFRVLKEVQDDE